MRILNRMCPQLSINVTRQWRQLSIPVVSLATFRLNVAIVKNGDFLKFQGVMAEATFRLNVATAIAISLK